MATTIGSHTIATFTSPVNGTTPIDANTVRGNDNVIQTAYNAHDTDPGIHVQSSSLASRPVAGTAGRKWITEDSGVYTLWFDDGTNWHPVSSENIALTVLAGENLVKGDVVKVTGWNNGQDLPEVVKTTSASDTAFAVITAAVSSGSMGYATNTGIVQDVNTAAYSVGTILYANGSGGFTSTKPTSGNYQPVAYVLRSNTNNGVYYVEFSTPRIVERSDNTASTVVLRDGSGNFSAGTITAGALTSTGLVTFASLKGTGATTVTDILNDSTMATASATTLATSASIKTYVDTKVATVDTLAEVLANGNTTGANDIIVNAGQKIRTPAVAAQDGTSAISIANSTGALTLNTALADSNLATISTAGKVSNSATTATSANTASAIVARDGSGDFAAGTITAALSGNASTATALQTARNINGVSFNGTADITVTAAAGTLSGNTLASGVTASSLTSVGTLSSLTVSGNVTLNSTSGNVGIGIAAASATEKLHVAGAIRATGAQTTAGTGVYLDQTAGVGGVAVYGPDNSTQGVFRVYTATANGGTGSEKLRIDASGNLGLGVTPSAWTNGRRALQIGGDTVSALGLSSAISEILSNAYVNSGAYKYANAGPAGIADFNNAASGGFSWRVAASGSADAAITFTQAMTLDASGNLGVGATSPSVNGIDIVKAGGTATYVRTSDGTYSMLSGVLPSLGVGLVGTTSNHPVAFYANNAERARITSDGVLQFVDTNALKIRFNGSAANFYGISKLAGGGSLGDGEYKFTAGDTVAGAFTFSSGGTERARITSAGSFVAGGSVALATTATDGFLYVPTCAGTPTGTPTAITGMAPIVVDTTNNKLYFYSGGTWRDAGP